MTSRRDVLKTSSLLLPGCAARRTPRAGLPASPRLAQVRVAADRVIRSIAGLRPFRPSGFVVRGEKLDGKTLIHNYGHGGVGITLSWGTAQLAVAEGAKTSAREGAVLGCGVVGLSTARLLQQRGYSPVIYAKELPPSTTSNVAGGLWEPIGPGGIYMFPRRDGVLLGGSWDRDVWSTEIVPATTERILRENAALFGAMRV